MFFSEFVYTQIKTWWCTKPLTWVVFMCQQFTNMYRIWEFHECHFISLSTMTHVTYPTTGLLWYNILQEICLIRILKVCSITNILGACSVQCGAPLLFFTLHGVYVGFVYQFLTKLVPHIPSRLAEVPLDLTLLVESLYYSKVYISFWCVW